jgi:hypothetical protein
LDHRVAPTFAGNHPNTTNLILDHQTFWMNLTESNLVHPEPKMQLRHEYSAKEDLKLENLSPESW